MADPIKTPAVETVAPVAVKEKNIQVSATLTPAEFAPLADLRFEQRHDKLSDLVKAAINEYVANHKR